MKVKIFSVKPLQKKDAQIEFEERINNWLAEKSDIEIIEIKQSVSGGSFNPSELYISVWYQEPEILGDEEDQ